MDGPTLADRCVRNARDARLIIHAVVQHKLPLIIRRLTDVERRAYIRTGSVFVWEERGPTSKSKGGIERWTDGKHWSPSRVRGEFLVYCEKIRDPLQQSQEASHPNLQDRLIKQTISVYVNTRLETRKWHLVAYFTQGSLDRLGTIDGMLDLACVPDLEEVYRSARITTGRARGEDMFYESQSQNRPDELHPYSPYDGFPSHNHFTLTHSLPTIPPAVSFDDMSESPQDHHRRLASRGDPRRTLAPLVYLQNVSAPPRPPLDDSAIRALDSIM